MTDPITVISEADAATPEATPAKRKIRISEKNMTLGDLEDFEEVTGMAFSDAYKTRVKRDEKGKAIADPKDPKGRPLQEVVMTARTLIGMIFITERKKDPSLTIEQVRNWTFDDFEFEMEQEEREGPKLATPTTSDDSELAD